MGWKTLPRNLLEQQFDSLGLEYNFEPYPPRFQDPPELDGTEKLSDYYDDEAPSKKPPSEFVSLSTLRSRVPTYLRRHSERGRRSDTLEETN